VLSAIDPIPLVRVTISLRSLRATWSTKASGGAHGVDVKHLRPRLVIDVPDGLASRSADASIVEEKVNGLPVELCGSRLNTHRVSDIQGQDLQFVIARARQCGLRHAA